MPTPVNSEHTTILVASMAATHEEAEAVVEERSV
jgi:hypothetical protein